MSKGRSESDLLDNGDPTNWGSEKISWAGRACHGPPDEDDHWGRRNMFEMVVSTTFGPRFDYPIQMERLKSVYSSSRRSSYTGAF